MALYRNMDRAALDAAYNNSAAVPDREAYIADWRRRSALMRARPEARLDLVYGEAPRARIDFFPAARPGAATLLFFHGGYWQRNDKEDFAFVAEGLLPAGINVALAGYTLAPAVRMDRIVAEARAAVRWLAAHLGELGGDPSRLYVSGWSAGGHLAASTMTEGVVRGGLAISGIYDLEPIRLNYLNEALGLDAEEAKRNSPLLQLPARAGRLIVAVGGAELPELRRQSETFAAAWRERALPGELQVIAGCDHFSVLEELARPATGNLAKAVMDLVGG